MIINLDKIEIPQKIVKELDYIFSYFGEIEKVILFGSRARRDNKENSDIDLAIYGIKEENRWKFSEMIDSINTLYSFDIIFIAKDTSEKLLSQIKKDGCIIYER